MILGIRESDFWEMTLAEVQREASAIQERKKNELKQQATFVHLMPELVACAVGRLFDHKTNYPSLYETFPDLFPEEYEKEKDRVQIQRFYQFANYHNKKQGEVK